jgi:phytoene dehydrogenase-like protein
VAASEVLSPVDLQDEFGATGGSLHHVERALDQMVLMRPARPFSRYATPVEGLYLGSSGCHPGPGVTLAPGVLAARAVLAR